MKYHHREPINKPSAFGVEVQLLLCPPVCEDSHKVSSPTDQKLPLPSSGEETTKVLENFKYSQVDFYYPFLTPELLALTGEDEWEQGRWLQLGNSVYGAAAYSLLLRDTPDLLT